MGRGRELRCLDGLDWQALQAGTVSAGDMSKMEEDAAGLVELLVRSAGAMEVLDLRYDTSWAIPLVRYLGYASSCSCAIVSPLFRISRVR